jgi:hypothetical protein
VDTTGAELQLHASLSGRGQQVHEEVLAVGQPVFVVGVLAAPREQPLGFRLGMLPAYAPPHTHTNTHTGGRALLKPCFVLGDRLPGRWLLVTHASEENVRRELRWGLAVYGAAAAVLLVAGGVMWVRGATPPTPASALLGRAGSETGPLHTAAAGLMAPIRAQR